MRRNQLRQAVNNYNRAVRQRNQRVKTVVSRYNQAVNRYNQAARSHNQRVRANLRRVENELARFARQSQSSHRHTTFYKSVQVLHGSYTQLEQSHALGRQPSGSDWILDLSERETANGLEVANRLGGESLTEVSDELELDVSDNIELLDSLRDVSPDLDARWRGAVFALDSRNPDAARHFCSSAREIFTQILVLQAPDATVLKALPECDVTDRGKPTRRSKIRYLLQRSDIASTELEDFTESDLDSIVELFNLFNEGTHGPAGVFGHSQLNTVRRRVEDGLAFLMELAR